MSRVNEPGTRLNVLISGAGIAGPCLAYWLERHGHRPTIVERAPALRTGGYVVDFWGAGFDVAERMGIVPAILEAGYDMREVRQVDRNGARTSSMAVSALKRLAGGRFTSLPRSELSRLMFESLGDRVETIFDDSVTAVDETDEAVRVQFERRPPRSFDLVVGADGLHSQVRRVVFGDGFERYLGIKVAAFSIAGYRPRSEGVYMMHTELGQQIGRFTMRDDRMLFLLIFKDPSPELPADADGQKALLRERFGHSGWESPNILAALDRADSFYLDRVSQIHMERWTRGRVALVGDAAFCVSLLGGQGSALAMVAAYVLAGELARCNGDHEAAFARYHDRLYDFLATKQRAATRLAPFFAPESRFGMFMRDQVMKLMSIPFVSKLAVGREMRDSIELPDYGASTAVRS
jgi:2-polyprenyl-6-methoxyphenol hydroxylase-like FAD-dependent oxidoreductase